jgi:glycine hydroxymethyltransferase
MAQQLHTDYLFRGTLADYDPDVADLIAHETARQARTLVMIPSESTVPEVVRGVLASSFHNIYAEGYPLDETRTMTEDQILDYDSRLPEYRRLADKRYYKGTEYADIVEALARRRAAELFATAEYPADRLFVNVQPLSGAPANNAIFSGLLTVGDTIMGLDLLLGGHLTHGSPVNRSGKQYKVVSYGLDPETERLDYDAIRALALEHRPKILIAGYTSYPFAPDWAVLRRIATEAGAYLMADVSHVSGLIIAGAYPSPVGYADVISFTTHKTLAGPRGAIILTHRADLAGKIDRAVFPGEQGGPHVNSIAALAVSLKLAATEQFRALQHQTVANAARFAERLAGRGIRIAYGGTDTHMVIIDCRPIVGPDGTALSGDYAARILDLAGIVANRNTVPGDVAALRASGVRFGTPWITQRGFTEAHIDRLADLVADLLFACVPFSYTGKRRAEPRAKVDFAVFQRVKREVRDLARSVGIDTDAPEAAYPHVSYLEWDSPAEYAESGSLFIRAIGHASAAAFLDPVLASRVLALGRGEQQPTRVLGPEGTVIARGVLERSGGDYILHTEHVGYVAEWLRALSDGFVLFDHDDPHAKIPGPVAIIDCPDTHDAVTALLADTEPFTPKTAYYIGQARAQAEAAPLPPFAWADPADPPLLRTPIHPRHLALGAKMAPFAGYEMPLWYTSVSDEHAAVRTRCGLFDVTHMGAFDVTGPNAAAFLDAVTTHDVHGLAIGDSQYTYFLAADGVPIDDLMIYRVGAERYLVVVNASNNDRDWAWLNAVLEGRVQIDPAHPARTLSAAGAGGVILRDLRAPETGEDRRVDVALQGPTSKAVLLALGTDEATRAGLSALPWAGVLHGTFGGFDLIVSRTGYTGERIAYELFVHPDGAAALFDALIAAGATPCGLAARDSLRTEAGLPLYGHELGVVLDGALTLNPADAGFGNYVRLWKPFFIGKAAFIAHEAARNAEIARFRLENRGARPAHPGDPVVDARGRVVGVVTSCSIDREGYQLGQAYLNSDQHGEGVKLGVFCGSARAKAATPAGAGIGARLTVPEPAVVLSRYPKKGGA